MKVTLKFTLRQENPAYELIVGAGPKMWDICLLGNVRGNWKRGRLLIPHITFVVDTKLYEQTIEAINHLRDFGFTEIVIEPRREDKTRVYDERFNHLASLYTGVTVD